MRDEDRDALVDLVTDTMKYYRQPVTTFILGVWLNGCASFDFQTISRAIHAHIADPERGRFPPLLSDIVRQVAGTPTDRAAVAWGKVNEAMRTVGAWQDIVFDDPVIHAVITDMGGWVKVARTENADLSYAIDRFVKTYRSLSERGFDGYPRVLAGARDSDEEYTRKGLPIPGPVLIGDPVQCALVNKRGGEARTAITFVPAGAALDRLPGGITLKSLPAPSGPEA